MNFFNILALDHIFDPFQWFNLLKFAVCPVLDDNDRLIGRFKDAFVKVVSRNRIEGGYLKDCPEGCGHFLWDDDVHKWQDHY